ncbi:Cif family virulence factor [Mucilaginibacter sp.]
MKKLLLSLLLLMSCATTFAQNRQAILKVLSDQQTAWNKGDIDGFMQGYWKSDSLVFVGKTAPQYGWQTTTDHYKKPTRIKQQWGNWHLPLLK